MLPGLINQAHILGYEVTLGDTFRAPRVFGAMGERKGYGHKNSCHKLKLAIDRKEFISRLDKIREIRNDIMHFDPQGVDPESLHALREFTRFLKELRRIGAV